MTADSVIAETKLKSCLSLGPNINATSVMIGSASKMLAKMFRINDKMNDHILFTFFGLKVKVLKWFLTQYKSLAV